MSIIHVPTSLSFISYPKCGRTWIRHILTQAISLYYQVDCQNPLDIWTAATKAGLPKILVTHDQAEWEPYREARNRPEVERRGLIRRNSTMIFYQDVYKDQKVVFMVRDPRDVLVSAYFQMTRVEQSYNGSLAEYVRDSHFGIKKIINFYKLWNENKDKVKGFLVVKYEDAQKDAYDVVKKVVDFVGYNEIDDETLLNAIGLSAFEKMRKNLSHYWINKKDPESHRMRKGKIGGFVNYLSQDDIKYVNHMMLEMGCPYYRPQDDMNTHENGTQLAVGAYLGS